MAGRFAFRKKALIQLSSIEVIAVENWSKNCASGVSST
jgi:hypothetical protein